MADIKHSIQISAKPEQIYPLVATAEGFGQWWAQDITEPPGAVELGFFKRATVYRLRLEADQQQARVEWACETGDEWNSTRIAFQMEATESGTLLRFTHAGWRAESNYFVSCNTTWGELMFRLKAVAEGKTPGPLFSAGGMAY
jgi:uncharacterized protein YndB with AHSA1/START domain